MSKKVVVKNPTRTRKWGWGWSCTPTGNDALSIERPGKPDYVGTFKQIREAQDTDRTYKSLRSGDTFTNSAIFYDGQVVEGIEGYDGSTQPLSCWDPEFDGKGPITLVVKD